MASRTSGTTSSATETLNSELLSAIYSKARQIDPRSTVLHDLSQLLNTGLDKETLATCVKMIEGGANPEALAVCTPEVSRNHSDQVDRVFI